MAIARHWRLSANLDRWLPRLSLKDSDEPNGAGEDAPADGDELSPVAKAQLPAASALRHLPSQMPQHRRLAGHPRLWLA